MSKTIKVSVTFSLAVPLPTTAFHQMTAVTDEFFQLGGTEATYRFAQSMHEYNRPIARAVEEGLLMVRSAMESYGFIPTILAVKAERVGNDSTTTG